jgi:hypothetical protein
MNARELAKHISKTGTRGVWFWGAGGWCFAPQDTARAYASITSSQYHTPGISLEFARGKFEKTMDFVAETERLIEPPYSAGETVMLTGTPSLPVFCEVSRLVEEEEAYHVFYNKVSKRGSKFAVFVDATHNMNLNDVARSEARTRWAAANTISEDDARAWFSQWLKNFTEVKITRVDDDDDDTYTLEIIREAGSERQ